MKALSVIVLSILFLASCGDNENEVSVNFKLEYDDQPLVMFDEYEYAEAGGFPIEFTRVSFFISDLALTVDGQQEIYKEVDYLDLTVAHASLERAQEGFKYDIANVTGDISNISFNFGLDEEINATVPADYPSSNVLSRTAEYWNGWESYVMFKIEGNIDFDRDGVKERGISLHLGTSEVMRSTSGPFSEDLSITLDIQDVFNCGEIFDIEGTPSIHSLSQIDKAIQLVDNIGCGLSYVN